MNIHSNAATLPQRGNRIAGLLIATSFLVMHAQRAEARTLVDDDFGFTLELSDAYQESALYKLASPDIIHVFTRGGDRKTQWVFAIENMGGMMRQNESLEGHLPPGVKAKVLPFSWQDYDIEGVEITGIHEGESIVTYNVQVPLKPRAIQLRLYGPIADQSHLKDEIGRLIKGLEGESNWSTRSQSARNRGRRVGRLGIFAVAVFVVGIVWWIRRH